MESKEINETNVAKNMKTSFQESLKSGITGMRGKTLS